jgi:hypothetical protein
MSPSDCDVLRPTHQSSNISGHPAAKRPSHNMGSGMRFFRLSDQGNMPHQVFTQLFSTFRLCPKAQGDDQVHRSGLPDDQVHRPGGRGLRFHSCSSCDVRRRCAGGRRRAAGVLILPEFMAQACQTLARGLKQSWCPKDHDCSGLVSRPKPIPR